jgi:hypothetical protein
MNFRNKLVFVPRKLFQHSLMFVDKEILSEASFWCLIIG